MDPRRILKQRRVKKKYSRSWIAVETRRKIRNNHRQKDPCLWRRALLNSVLSPRSADSKIVIVRKERTHATVVARGKLTSRPSTSGARRRSSKTVSQPCKKSPLSLSLREQQLQMLQKDLLSAQRVVDDVDSALGLNLDKFFADVKGYSPCSDPPTEGYIPCSDLPAEGA